MYADIWSNKLAVFRNIVNLAESISDSCIASDVLFDFGEGRQSEVSVYPEGGNERSRNPLIQSKLLELNPVIKKTTNVLM